MGKIILDENTNWVKFLQQVKSMTQTDCITELGRNWLPMWKGLQCSREGDVVIQVIRGGNEYMQVGGTSKCGYTPGIQVDVPIVIEQPNGNWYKGGVIKDIDWENETFKTAQSTYSFHFVKK